MSMLTPASIDQEIAALTGALGSLGRPLAVLIAACALLVGLAIAVPAFRGRLRAATAALLAALSLGEAVLVWFHVRLGQACVVVEPQSGRVTGGFALPVWIESEKLYALALLIAVIAVAARRHGEELRPLLAGAAAALAIGALIWGRPFAAPLPDFLAQYRGYLAAWASGDAAAAMRAFASIEGSRQYFYNAWYMWVHPPLLFVSYGAFAASFAATLLMIVRRRSSYEQTAYRWARLGYLPLTAGMILGMPWAIVAWKGEAWWWSGKVNMSLMMWALYTAYLHGRLYLRRPGMWKAVAALSVVAFVALVLTYLTTYLVPGVHSVA
ncbi:MAG: cytochrome c biogenesis protein CcsA [Coriobacteriia bacterium]|nr:cytochrome c biogenesis protein CcsA [Coriobacteriia bacterium]